MITARVGGGLALLLAAASSTLAAQAPRPVEPRAVLDAYCVGCHNARLRTGNLALDGLNPSDIGAAPDTWEKVVRKLRTREMPPAGARRPDDDTATQVIQGERQFDLVVRMQEPFRKNMEAIKNVCLPSCAKWCWK